MSEREFERVQVLTFLSRTKGDIIIEAQQVFPALPGFARQW